MMIWNLFRIYNDYHYIIYISCMKVKINEINKNEHKMNEIMMMEE